MSSQPGLRPAPPQRNEMAKQAETESSTRTHRQPLGAVHLLLAAVAPQQRAVLVEAQHLHRNVGQPQSLIRFLSR
eukprot:COSAG01_NODE_10456_length_2161_cov_5.449079_1_plen_75_part_00